MFEVKELCGQLCLGKQGENLARIVYFNEPSLWKEKFGEGKCELLHQRNGDAVPYPVLLETEGDRVCWKITNADTAIVGEGKCELYYSVNGAVVKSKILTTTVLPSLGSDVVEPPEPQKAWVDEVLSAAQKVEEAESLCKEAKGLCEEAKDLANDFPIIEKNSNTLVAKKGNHSIAENCNDGLVIGNSNKYNEGRYSVIFGVDNEVTGHSNVVSGSHNVVKGLHNLVVGNKLRVDDDGTAQVIFGLGEDVPISKDVALAYYNLGKKTFEVLKDGTLTLNDKRFVSMPVCEPEGEDYILQCDTINKNYSMDKMITKGGTQYCHRMVVSKLQVPEITPDWAGHQITFHHIDTENKEHTESFIIKVVEQRADNRNQWNIDFYRSCSYWEPHSDPEVRAYWNGGFTITGGTYSWLSKYDLFEEIKTYIQNN